MANWPTKLALQIVLTMDDINAQTCERLRAASLLPLGLGLVWSSSSSSYAAGITTVAALRGAGSINTVGSTTVTALHGSGTGSSSSSSAYIHYLSRESRELVYEVFRTKVAVKLFVWPAGRP